MRGGLPVLAIIVAAAMSAFGQDAPPQPDPGDPGPLFRGQTVPSDATLIFKFDNPQLQPAKFQITLHADGKGHFISQVGEAPPADIADLPPEGQERDITVSDAAKTRIFLIAEKEHGFSGKCDAGKAKVAFQGTKTLMYDGPGQQGKCTYNYTSDAKLQWLTTEMLGIATTLEEGRRLAVMHEHGRLTLDAELETLAKLQQDGEATEIANIAPTLREILADANVMDRARRRAQVLLDSDPSTAVH